LAEFFYAAALQFGYMFPMLSESKRNSIVGLDKGGRVEEWSPLVHFDERELKYSHRACMESKFPIGLGSKRKSYFSEIDFGLERAK
jgi:hypothetical protein